MLPSGTVIIAGPTGVGKTALSLRIGEILGGEIVGADAFQLYAGLPLLTAQPSPQEQARVPHHLIGSVDLSENFDAGRYLRTAEPIVHDIAARGRIPILVGGTGLYFKALLGGLNELPQDPTLRKTLSLLSLPALIEQLRTSDPEAPNQIELANRRRVERALEIVLLTGLPLAASRTASQTALPAGVRALLVSRDREELNKRIAANVAAMFERGVAAEVAAIPEEIIGPTATMTLGLREIRSHLRGEISRIEAIESITTATRRYAKRQLTWFRNQHDFSTLNLSEILDPNQIVQEALEALSLGIKSKSLN